MEKKIVSLCLIASIATFSNDTFAQAWTTSGTNLVTNGSVNNVGIKTSSPSDALTVNGTISYLSATSTYRFLLGRSSQAGLHIYSDNSAANGSLIALNSYANPSEPGAISLIAADGGTGSSFALKVMTYDAGAYTSRFAINKMGNTAIGTAITSDKLTVGGNTSINGALKVWGNLNVDGHLDFEPQTTPGIGDYRAIRGNVSHKGLVLYANGNFANGSGVIMNGFHNTTDPGCITFVSGDDAVGNVDAFIFKTYDGGAMTSRMFMKKDGQVVIGNAPTVNTSNYKLYVQTGILTEKLKVASVAGGQWSDYVFADDYQLKSLNEVEEFITKNKHLPDVPSASNVEQNGYDITTMDATLLQKIEELTLYIIQLQKEVESLKKAK